MGTDAQINIRESYLNEIAQLSRNELRSLADGESGVVKGVEFVIVTLDGQVWGNHFDGSDRLVARQRPTQAAPAQAGQPARYPPPRGTSR